MKVDFAYEPGQIVNTPVGEIGVIGVCAVDRHKTIQYSVKLPGTTHWFDEDELIPAEVRSP